MGILLGLAIIGGAVAIGTNIYAASEVYKTYSNMKDTLMEIGEAAVSLEKVKMQQYLIMLFSGFVSIIAAAVILRKRRS